MLTSENRTKRKMSSQMEFSRINVFDTVDKHKERELKTILALIVEPNSNVHNQNVRLRCPFCIKTNKTKTRIFKSLYNLKWHLKEHQDEVCSEFSYKDVRKIIKSLEIIHGKSTNRKLEFEIEECIIKDKTKYGRVRNSMMKNLRMKYGTKAADRALWRVNKELERNISQNKYSEIEN